MQINFGNLSNFKSSFRHYEIRNLFRLIKDNNYPTLGLEFSFTDQKDAKKPFKGHYRKYILPHVEVFELKRIETLRNLRKRSITAIPFQIITIITTIAAIYYLPKGDATQVSLVIGFMGLAGLGYWSHKPVRKYAANVKAEVFPEIFRFFGENYLYSESSPLKMELLEVSGIIQKPGTWVFVSDNDGTDSVLTAPCKNPRYNVASLETAGLDADYIVIYVAGQRYETDSVPVYEIHGGADETKIPWWITIAEEKHSKYYIDGSIPTQNLLSNTLIGNLLPFSIITYLDPNTMEQYSDYRRGLIPIYVQDIKFHDLDGPFTLAYASPNFSEQGAGLLHSVLIYKINHEFIP